MDIILSVCSGVARSFNAIERKIASQYMGELALVFWLRVFMLLGLLIIIFVMRSDIPILNQETLPIIIGVGIVESIATFYSFRAVKNGSLSLVAPLESSTPLLLLPLGFVFLGEKISGPLVLSVLCLSSGVYLLLLKPRSDWRQPFRALLHDIVASSVLVYALLSSITVLGEKYLLRSMDVFWVLAFVTFTQIIVIAVFARIKRTSLFTSRDGYKAISRASILTIISRILELLALSISSSALVIAVRKVDTLFTIVLAKIRLKEKISLRQYIATAIIIAGVVLAAVY